MLSDRYNRDMGMQYWYVAPPVALPAGIAPAAGNNWLGVPGIITQTQFTIVNDDFVGIDLLCVSDGPFLAQIQVGYVDLIAGIDGQSQFLGGHSATLFGSNAGQPNRLFIPFDAPLNYVVTFKLQDISYAANNLVYITVNGVQKKQQG